MFKLRQLECAIALADQRHFGTAARSMGITASGLTQSIQRLEEHYGEPLFIRDRKGVVPTQYGEIFLEGARDILEREAAIKREIGLVSSLETGHLRIGCDPLLSNSVMAPALASLLEFYPNVQFSLITGNWDHLEALMLRRDIDIFLSFEQTAQYDFDFEVQKHQIASPVVVCAPKHPLLEKSERNLVDFFDYPLLASSLAQWYLEWAKERLSLEKGSRAPKVDYYLYSDDIMTLKTIAKTSTAMVALLKTDLEQELLAGELIELMPNGWPERVPVVVATRGELAQSVSAKAVVSALQNSLENC